MGPVLSFASRRRRATPRRRRRAGAVAHRGTVVDRGVWAGLSLVRAWARSERHHPRLLVSSLLRIAVGVIAGCVFLFFVAKCNAGDTPSAPAREHNASANFCVEGARGTLPGARSQANARCMVRTLHSRAVTTWGSRPTHTRKLQPTSSVRTARPPPTGASARPTARGTARSARCPPTGCGGVHGGRVMSTHARRRATLAP